MHVYNQCFTCFEIKFLQFSFVNIVAENLEYFGPHSMVRAETIEQVYIPVSK
jgi:hypothetical protein